MSRDTIIIKLIDGPMDAIYIGYLGNLRSQLCPPPSGFLVHLSDRTISQFLLGRFTIVSLSLSGKKGNLPFLLIHAEFYFTHTIARKNRNKTKEKTVIRQ